jgi:predicted dehydrogenase
VPLKRSLLAGAIGPIRHATVHACWPRNEKYFQRAPWAGRFKRNGAWVMDSPANNALAHYINIPLFLMGPTLETSAQPVAVEAELYRANSIENFDTISMRVTLETGATLLVLFTHACEKIIHPEVVIHGPGGLVRRTNERITIQTPAGSEVVERGGDPRFKIVRCFAKAVRGQSDPDFVLATLEVARAPLAAVNGASEASVIHDIDPAAVRTIVDDNGKLMAVEGIEVAFDACARQNQMLHASGLVKWSKPAGHRDLRGYRHFAGPAVAAAMRNA